MTTIQKVGFYLEILLAFAVLIAGANFLLDYFQPGYFQDFVAEWSGAGNVFSYFFNKCYALIIFILNVPDWIFKSAT